MRSIVREGGGHVIVAETPQRLRSRRVTRQHAAQRRVKGPRFRRTLALATPARKLTAYCEAICEKFDRPHGRVRFAPPRLSPSPASNAPQEHLQDGLRPATLEVFCKETQKKPIGDLALKVPKNGKFDEILIHLWFSYFMFGLETLTKLLDVVRSLAGAFDASAHSAPEVLVPEQPMKYTRFEHKHLREKCDSPGSEQMTTETGTNPVIVENLTINQYFGDIKNDQFFDFVELEKLAEVKLEIEDVIRAVTDEANSHSRHWNDEVYSQSIEPLEDQLDDDQLVDGFDFTFIQDFG